jgi:hypothetical protein
VLKVRSCLIDGEVSRWHPARNEQKSNTSEAAEASPEDDIGVRTSEHHGPWQKETDATYGKAPHIATPRSPP